MMRGFGRRFPFVATPRAVMALVLALGLVATLVNEQTSANIGVVIRSSPSDFESGTVDIAGLLAGSSAPTLPSATAFTWNTGGAGADCASVLPLPDITTQQMAPGHYCVAKVTIHNDNLKSVDAWLRMRLVRRTAAGNAQSDAMNDRLRFYMHEYSAGTTRTAAQYQTDDCSTATYKPEPPVAGTARSSSTIPDTASSTLGSRTALSALGTAGKNIGVHPGVALPADSAVAALAGTGFAINAGTALGSLPTETATLDSSNMSTLPGSRNAFNIVGNDEVTNPRQTNNSNATNGTRASGTLPEANLAKRTSRYYCAALFFPSDTDPSAGNATGDNAAATGNLTYHLVITAAQQSARTVAGFTPTPAPTATPSPTATRTPTPLPTATP